MSIVCGNCGSENRENAMFCGGCAGRLPGFAPTGASALDSMRTLRVPHTSHPPHASPDEASLRPPGYLTPLPAETPAFWLRLGLLALAMMIGFFGWYIYVTRKTAEPWLPARIAAVLGLQDASSAPVKTAPADAVPAATPVTPVPRPAAPAIATAPATAGATARATASSPTPVAAAPAPKPEWMGSGTSVEDAPAEAPSASPPKRFGAASAQLAPQQPRRRARAQERAVEDDPSPPIAVRTEPGAGLPRASTWPQEDPGPPIVAGPGPRFAATPPPPPSSSSFREDPGPPIVAGPGPVAGSARPSIASGADPGPPIAIGPGPLYDTTRMPPSR